VYTYLRKSLLWHSGYVWIALAPFNPYTRFETTRAQTSTESVGRGRGREHHTTASSGPEQIWSLATTTHDEALGYPGRDLHDASAAVIAMRRATGSELVALGGGSAEET
jgi:hypothetical protein